MAARSESIPKGMKPPLWIILIELPNGRRETIFEHPAKTCMIL